MTDCIKTDDATSGTKNKCCLATFGTIPTTSNSKAVTAYNTGSAIADSKFYACYKKTGGSILFTTSSTSTTEKSMPVYISAADVCGTKANTAVSDVAMKKIDKTGTAIAATDKFAGTAKTCVCGASYKFVFGL